MKEQTSEGPKIVKKKLKNGADLFELSKQREGYKMAI